MMTTPSGNTRSSKKKKRNCSTCSKTVLDEERFIECFNCSKYHHETCAGVPEEISKLYMDKELFNFGFK